MLENYHGRWLAVRVRPNAERAVALGLRSRGYEDFLPTFRRIRRWHNRLEEVTLPLFAGYVFCRFDSRVSNPIVATPGVLHIVGNGKAAVPIEDEEILSLQAVTAHTDLHVSPWPRLEKGLRVRIHSGPLQGLTGVLLNVKNASSLVVSLSLLQRSVAVEIQLSWASTITDPTNGKGPRLMLSSDSGFAR